MGFELALFVFLLLVALRALYTHRRSKPDPEWEQRWASLPQLQRDHIAETVRQGTPLADPEEAEMAAGLARRQHSTATLFSHSGVVHLLLAGAFLLTALIDPSPLILAPVLILLAALIWIAYRERVTKRNLERTEEAASSSWAASDP